MVAKLLCSSLNFKTEYHRHLVLHLLPYLDQLLHVHVILTEARSDLAFYYKQCIDGIEEIKREAWYVPRDSNSISPKDKLLALKVISMCLLLEIGSYCFNHLFLHPYLFFAFLVYWSSPKLHTTTRCFKGKLII
jgi:hypothetical protein